MAKRIHYQIHKYQFTEVNESARMASQWSDVLNMCRHVHAGAEERLRIALLNVDYVTSFELPFRLQLTRVPQLMEQLRGEMTFNRKAITVGDNRYGCVYSLSISTDNIPDQFHYRFVHRIHRMVAGEMTTSPYQEIARQTKSQRERLKLALEAGLLVTALDGLFWFGIQRIAADISRLRASGMSISTSEVEAFDTMTETTRFIPAYRKSEPA
jgi:hypothetical protein